MADAARACPAVKPLEGWIPGQVLADYLSEKLPARDGTPVSAFKIAKPLVPELRVGLAREGRAARTGYLYQATHLRLREGWGFLAEVTVRGEWDAGRRTHIPFGGRGRLADVGPAVVHWPEPEAGSLGTKVLVYLATPAIWPGGWSLPVPARARLVAAATGEPEPAATVRRGPEWAASRALRWTVPAGSVYLLEFSDAGAASAWAARSSKNAYGRDEDDLLRTAGFGVVLTGAWT